MNTPQKSGLLRYSIVIPAKNEEEYIAGAIGSLQRQTVERADYEIIAVVEAASTDRTKEKAKEAGADVVICEELGGTNFARQRGVEASKGAVVAFLDADCRAPKDWLEKMGNILSRDGVVGVSGPYDHGFTGIVRLVDILYSRVIFPRVPALLHAIFRKKAGVMIGGNFAAHRRAIDAIGGLPPLKFFGDDAATAMLLSRKVGKVVFDPDVVVYSSPRRFAGGNYFQVIRYAFVYLKVYFDKRYE